MKKTRLNVLTASAVLAALSTIIYYFLPEIPIIPGVPYLKIDLSDFPAIIAAFVFGPLAAIAVELIKNLIHLFKTSTFGIGEICNFIVGISLAIPFAFFYKLFNKRNVKQSLAYFFAAVAGIISIVVFGLAANFIFVPVYFKLAHIPFVSSAYISFSLSSVPLNLVKGIINAIVILPILFALKRSKIYSDK